MRRNLLLLAVLLGSLNILLAQKLDIIPKAVNIEQNEGVFTIPSSTNLILDEKVKSSAPYIRSEFIKTSGITPKISIGNKQQKNSIVFLVASEIDLPNDGYQLSVTKKGVLIKGKSPNCVLNGFQTLL